ncbi:hypothetical protein AXF42_Ash019115 [Apostasia shenzhenica]|uniref:30S ribosomal protein S6 n=1 Tax=Apostasia shenzhenica TaxID=1088818 RepID=A0A2I0AAB6_9ASPA|nr:hypothetical protein AXF42_Ash019115 [Apostasia shenzhenica]
MASSPSSSAVRFLLNTERVLLGECFLRRLVSQKVFSYSNKLFIGGPRILFIVRAKKSKEKPDGHSFVVKPNEATGPFPEAVLLKKKVLKGDGRIEPEFADAEEERLYEFLKLQLESDLKLERMRHYEVVYLIHEERVDEVDSVVSKVQEFIREKKGRIWRLNNWGIRRLAYKIKKASKANYILMNFEVEAKWINEFKTMLDKDERIIRHLVIKRDEAITKDCPPPPEYHSVRAEQGMDEDYSAEDEEEEEEENEDQSWLHDELEMEGNGSDGYDYLDEVAVEDLGIDGKSAMQEKSGKR